MQVGAADPAVRDIDAHGARPYGGLRDVLDADVTSVVIACGLHLGSLLRLCCVLLTPPGASSRRGTASPVSCTPSVNVTVRSVRARVVARHRARRAARTGHGRGRRRKRCGLGVRPTLSRWSGGHRMCWRRGGHDIHSGAPVLSPAPGSAATSPPRSTGSRPRPPTRSGGRQAYGTAPEDVLETLGERIGNSQQGGVRDHRLGQDRGLAHSALRG